MLTVKLALMRLSIYIENLKPILKENLWCSCLSGAVHENRSTAWLGLTLKKQTVLRKAIGKKESWSYESEVKGSFIQGAI